jgi:hypothetical protein
MLADRAAAGLDVDLSILIVRDDIERRVDALAAELVVPVASLKA